LKLVDQEGQARAFMRNKKLYAQTLKDFDELSLAKATGLFDTPASQVKEIFEDRFADAVLKEHGNPDAVRRNMLSHAASVILSLAENSARKLALRKAFHETNTHLVTTWSADFGKGEIHIYSYLPFEMGFGKKSIVREEIIKGAKGPYEDTALHIENNIKVFQFLEKSGWYRDSLIKGGVGMDDIYSKFEPVQGILLPTATYDIGKISDSIVKNLKERYEPVRYGAYEEPTSGE